jgi:hypothetical protein
VLRGCKAVGRGFFWTANLAVMEAIVVLRAIAIGYVAG